VARRRLEELNATFPVEDEPGNSERLVSVDWMPRIIAEGEWRTLSAGLLQRGRAINAWLRAVYGEGQGLVPEEIVRSSVFYRPHDLPGDAPPVHLYGPDVVHLSSGEYVVLEDNLRVPSGAAYSEAIRRAGMEAMPELYGAYRLAGIFSDYDRLRETLELAAPNAVEDPNIAVITRGGKDPAFFEHNRIAEACGIALLALGDCRVSNRAVFVREDGRRLDVIYRRFDEDYVDTDLPELNRVYFEGNVGFVNAPGVGVADDRQSGLPLRSGHDRTLPRRDPDPRQRPYLLSGRGRGPRASPGPVAGDGDKAPGRLRGARADRGTRGRV
jgi:uncharacterized circularly permuted ATP-grasp superfamily protein